MIDDSFDSLDDISETESVCFELDRKTMSYVERKPLQASSSTAGHSQ
jgi:hypothetical protein